MNPSNPAEPPANPLKDSVAVVAGATRGAGRGVARGLGESGALVYCTGRSGSGDRSDYDRPETIEETANLITSAGGKAVPVKIDHTDETATADLFRKIAHDHGKIDILVNSIAGEDPRMGQWGAFWEANLEHAPEILNNTIVSHFITAKYAAQTMLRQNSGLIVEITESDQLTAGGNPIAQTTKIALKTATLNRATELHHSQIAAIALTPGFLRSEAILDHFQVDETTWRQAIEHDPNFEHSESPVFLGRVIAALATDPDLLTKSGQVYGSWELARIYGTTDVDGTQPDWGAVEPDLSALPKPFLEQLAGGAELSLRWLKSITQRTERFHTRLSNTQRPH